MKNFIKILQRLLLCFLGIVYYMGLCHYSFAQSSLDGSSKSVATVTHTVKTDSHLPKENVNVINRSIHLPAYFTVSLATFQGKQITFLPISLGLLFPLDYSAKKNIYMIMTLESGLVNIHTSLEGNLSHYTAQMGFGERLLFIPNLKPLYKGGYYRNYRSLFGYYVLGRYDILQNYNLPTSAFVHINQVSIVGGVEYWYEKFGITGSILFSPSVFSNNNSTILTAIDRKQYILRYESNTSASLYLYWNLINNLDVYVHGRPVLESFRNGILKFNLEKFVGIRGYTMNSSSFFGGEVVDLELGYDKSGFIIQMGIAINFNINPQQGHLLPTNLLPMEKKLLDFPLTNLSINTSLQAVQPSKKK